MSKSRLLKQYTGVLNSGSPEAILNNLPKIEAYASSPLLNANMRDEMNSAIRSALEKDYGKDGLELLEHLTRISKMFSK